MPDSDDDTTLRPIQNAKETAKRYKAGVLSWLPSAKTCPDCGELCTATWTYDTQQAAFNEATNGKTPSWECEGCGRAWRRERSEGLGFDIWK